MKNSLIIGSIQSVLCFHLSFIIVFIPLIIFASDTKLSENGIKILKSILISSGYSDGVADMIAKSSEVIPYQLGSKTIIAEDGLSESELETLNLNNEFIELALQGMIPGSSKKDNDLDPDEINLIFCNIRNYSDWAGINFDSAVKLYYNTKHFSMQTNVTDETITTILGMCYTTNELMDKVKVFPLIKFIKNNSLQVITQNSILEKFGQNICLDTLSVEVEMIKKLCRALVELELISRLDISKQHQLLIEKGYDANQVSLPKNNTSSKERSVQTIIDWIRSTQEYHVERNTEEMIASPPIP